MQHIVKVVSLLFALLLCVGNPQREGMVRRKTPYFFLAAVMSSVSVLRELG